MTKKLVKAKSSSPKYFRALDLMMAAVEYTRRGMPVRAAKALAAAAQDEQVDQALEQLNDQQQDNEGQQGMDFEQQQAETSRVLANLIKSAHKPKAGVKVEVKAEAEDEDDEDLEDEDLEEEQDDVEETAEVGDDEDDLSLSLDQEEEDEDGDMPVQASVSARLSRAARNKARRAA